jgi:hypothetical protein
MSMKEKQPGVNYGYQRIRLAVFNDFTVIAIANSSVVDFTKV